MNYVTQFNVKSNDAMQHKYNMLYPDISYWYAISCEISLLTCTCLSLINGFIGLGDTKATSQFGKCTWMRYYKQVLFRGGDESHGIKVLRNGAGGWQHSYALTIDVKCARGGMQLGRQCSNMYLQRQQLQKGRTRKLKSAKGIRA
jgi:hypothetical protein